mmetsp:Transcript_66630/g.192460  ORF Transcript_66630/g.192460 Transcript_66630/m.192460 type:complete len:286 (+) Transcript_66630:1058-1915(+)
MINLLHRETDAAVGHVQELAAHALGGLPRVLMRVLLVPGQLIRAHPRAPVRVRLARLDQVPFVRTDLHDDAQQDHIDDADQVLVLGGVDEEPGLAVLDLGHEDVERLCLAAAELVQRDVVVRQDLRDGLVVHLVVPRGRRHRPHLEERELELLGLLRRPPRVLDRAVVLAVEHREGMRVDLLPCPSDDVLLRLLLLLLQVRLPCVGACQTVNQLSPPFLDACIRTGLLQIRVDDLRLLLGVASAAEVRDVCDEGVVHGMPRLYPRLLATVQCSVHELHARLVHAA